MTRERVARGQAPVEAVGAFGGRVKDVLSASADDALEAPRLRLIVQELSHLEERPESTVRAREIPELHVDEAVDVLVHRVRIEQHALDHARNRGGRADPERERQHGGGGEGRLLSQASQPVDDVLPQALEQLAHDGLESGGIPRGTRVFLDQGHVAERAPRRVRRFFGRDAGLALFVFLLLEVGSELALEVSLPLLASDGLSELVDPASHQTPPTTALSPALP